MTFDELAAQRDPLYRVTKPVNLFTLALSFDTAATQARHPYLLERARDEILFTLTIRALRNQGEPYYPRKGQP